MADPPTIPAPQYTLIEALSVCLAMCQRALAEVRALSRIPGPAGECGPEGKRGLRGEIGEKGERGEPGKAGPAGPAGTPGQDGINGKDGTKGEAGRNASDLTLLQEYIDQRFERALEAATVTTSDGGRTLRWSIGNAVREIKTAIVLDAGIWTERTYAAGDGVTLGGSFWIAQTETAAKPGKSDDWRLAVKRGNDGRDWRPDEKRVLEPVRFK